MVESNKKLVYLDQDLYVKQDEKDEFEEHYVCLICYGVVLNPTEC